MMLAMGEALIKKRVDFSSANWKKNASFTLCLVLLTEKMSLSGENIGKHISLHSCVLHGVALFTNVI